MSDIELKHGDLMVVDRSEYPCHGDIAIADIEVKQLQLSSEEPRITLQPMNSYYSPIYPAPDTLEIFGMVMFFLHKTRGD